ncbi:hypothetical protein SAVIM338S_02271 [Streptomyces avidinii]
MSFIKEEREVRAYFYNPHRTGRAEFRRVLGWHLNGVKPAHTGMPYGVPILISDDGAAILHDAKSADFIGLSTHPAEGERIQERARKRWERENAERMKTLAEQKAAADAVQAMKDHTAKEAAETARRLSEEREAILSAGPGILSSAIQTLKEHDNV